MTRAVGIAHDPRAQLDFGLAGEADVVYGYSFILCDRDGDAATVEHHHRDRAQLEERIKDAKLGVSLRRLPLSDLEANRVWLHCSTLALNLLNLLALLNELMFGTDPPGHLPRPRQAKFVRRMWSASPPGSSTTPGASSSGSPPACPPRPPSKPPTPRPADLHHHHHHHHHHWPPDR